MKQKFLSLVSLVLIAVQGWALPVDESSARAIVQDFVIEKRGINPNSVPTSGNSDLQLLHAEMSSVNVTMKAYYIYNTGDGFVIVAGDDRAERILGYGDEELDMNDIPCCMQFMLDSYKEQIDYLLEHPELEVETPSMNAPMLTATSVAPMLTARWGQSEPYYNLTPLYNGKHCKTGCSCVALCQVMHYWKKPTTLVPSLPAYISKFRGVTIDVPELPSDRFHWNYIKDSYSGSYTADEAYSVAKLMRYAGQAMEMGYTLEASGASLSDILIAAKLFGYNRNAEVLDRDDYSDAEWAALIQAELIAGRPIVYCGFNKSHSVGHSFNIDGYRASDKKYHMNWGFRGNADGYYALNAFNPLNNNFNYMQYMIVGLEPQDPEIVIITPATLSFRAKAGETKTATFDLKGYALTGNLTVKLNNGGNVYSIDKTSITMSEAAYRTTVTVTYKPTEPGTSNASVTISGGGAASKTVSLSGTASAATTITTTPSSLSFNAYVGETKTETFTVKCPNAISNLKLTLNNGGNIYSIDKTSISKSAANSGVNVTVTYKPMVAGTSNASVTISGGGANPKTVSLSGNATIKPEITINPASLSFKTYVGKAKTDSVTVKCPYAKSDLILELKNGGTIYSIDKTIISKSDAINGTSVAVTYSPTEDGLSNASVTISGGGAEAKTVALDGCAVIPGITTDVSAVTFDTTYTGYEGSQTIIITGTNLLNDIQLNFTHDYTNSFALSKYTITPDEAAAGAEVTVYFTPLSGGRKHATLNIKSDGVETVSIPLSGAGIKSDGYITAWPTELSFESQLGTSVTKTFKVTYSKNDDDNGFIMINCTDNGGETDFNEDGESEGYLPKLKSSKRISELARIHLDTIAWRKKFVLIDPIATLDCIFLKINLTGDDCFSIPQYCFGLVRLNRINPNNKTYSATISVTYQPDEVGENEAFLKISSGENVKPFILPLHGTATAQLNAPGNNNDLINALEVAGSSSERYGTTDVSELAMNSKVYANGQSIIIESPVEQRAIICDIAGRARSVNLQAGRNEIPVNASGIYIVRIREKTTKLMLK